MKKKLVFFSFIALLLAGCGGETSSTSSFTLSSSSEPVPSLPSSEAMSSSAELSSQESTVSSSSSIMIQEEWSSEIKEAISSYGIDIDIPYITGLGEKATAEREDYTDYLLIENDESIYNADDEDEKSYLNQIAIAFSGWKVTVKETNVYGHYYTSDYMMEAVSEDGSVIVDIFGEKESRNAKDFYLRMVIRSVSMWNESEFTTWDDTIKADFDTYLHSHQIPDIYLGNANPTGTYHFTYSYRSYYELDGGDWHDEVLTDAESILSAAGFTVDNSADISSFTGFWAYNYGLTASKTYEDGCTLYLELGDVGSINPKIEMRAYILESYDSSHTVSDWSSNTKNDMKTYLSGNELPYVYLGTNQEREMYVTSSTIGDYLLIQGGEWNDAIINEAENAFKTDGYIVREGTRSDTIGQWTKGKSVIAKKTLDDGSVITAELGYSGNYNVPLMQVFYQPCWSVPEGKTAWNESTSDAISSFVSDKATIPYTYLGKDDGGNDIETSGLYQSYYNGDCLMISGGVFFDTFTEYAKSIYQKAGWIISASPYWSYRTGFTATYTTEDGDRIEVQVGANYNGVINILVFYEEAMVIPDDGSYSSYIQELIENTYGDDITIPYIYQGDDVQNASYVTGNYYGDYLEITGGKRKEQILDNAIEVLTGDGWTVTSGGIDITTGYWSYGYQTGYYCVVGTKEVGENIYQIEVGQNSAGKSVIRIYCKKKFTPPSDDASYSNTVLSNIALYTDQHGIPYVYLNSDDVTSIGYYSYYDGYFLSGGLWDDQLTDLIKEELEDAGYTVTVTQNDGSSYYMGTNNWCYGASTLIQGTKTFDDGCTITVEAGDYFGSYAYLMIGYDCPYSSDYDFGGYDEELKEYFNYYIHGFDLPDVYIGKVYNSTYYIGADEFIIQGTDWSDAVVLDAKKTLEDAGWSVSYDEDDLSTGLTATKKNDLSETCTCVLSEENGKITLSFTYEENDEREEDDSSSYPQFILDGMESSVGFTIPYVYLGKKNAYFASGDGYCYFYVDENFDSESCLQDMFKDSEYDFELVSGTGENDRYYVFEADDGDGGKYIVTIGRQGDETGYLYMQHVTKYDMPSPDDNWSTDLQKVFYDEFGSSVPYADLGSGTISQESYGNYVYLYADGSLIKTDYNDMYDYTLLNFTSDEDWTVTESYDEDGQRYFNATKDMGDYTIDVTYGLSYYFGPQSEVAFLVTKTWKYILPQSEGSWNSSVSSYFSSYYGDDIEIPWMYLGCPDDAVYVYSGSTADDLYLFGGTWDDSMVLTIAGKLQYNGWSVSYDSSDLGSGLTATKTGEDGKTYTIRLVNSAYYGTYLEITVEEP